MTTPIDSFIRRRRTVLARGVVALSMVAGLLGCNDGTGPNRTQVEIGGIVVPLVAATMDTIVIKFTPEASGCSTGLIVDSQIMRDQVRFAASVDATSSTSVCPVALVVPGSSAVQLPFVYIVAPPHITPFTVRFAQPGRADDVLVVKAP